MPEKGTAQKHGTVQAREQRSATALLAPRIASSLRLARRPEIYAFAACPGRPMTFWFQNTSARGEAGLASRAMDRFRTLGLKGEINIFTS